MVQEDTVQVACCPLLRFEFQCRIEYWLTAVQAVALNHQRFRRFSECPVVAAVHLQEWRHMKLLLEVVTVGIAFRTATAVLGREPVIVRLTKSVVYLGHDHLQSFMPVIAIKERDRIEVVAKIAQMRKQENWAARQLDSMLLCVSGESLAEAETEVAKMVFVVEARPVPAVVAGEGRNPHQSGELVDVQKDHEYRIGEVVPDGAKPPMSQRAGVDCRPHLRITSRHPQETFPSPPSVLGGPIPPRDCGPRAMQNSSHLHESRRTSKRRRDACGSFR